MRHGLAVALVLAGSVAVAPRGFALGVAGGQNGQPGQNKQIPAAQKPSTPESQAQGNPFPGSTTSAPILPSGPNANVPPGFSEQGNAAAMWPANDTDPVRSPDNTAPDADAQQGWSSSQTGLSDLLPPPDNGQGNGKNEPLATLPPETPANDISVGNYYLSNKNWKAALSRFQSALVLDPQSADVYWGLAESERHLGDYADARADYLKVLEYDPGTRHSKDAARYLREPEIANAQASAPAKAPQTQQ